MRLSWAQSLEHLSAPERSAPQVVLNGADVRWAREPLRLLPPALDDLLTPLAEDTRPAVAVTDRHGVLLHVGGSTGTWSQTLSVVARCRDHGLRYLHRVPADCGHGPSRPAVPPGLFRPPRTTRP